MEKPKRSFTSWIGRLSSEDIRVEHGDVELVAETPSERKKHRLRNASAMLALPVLVVAIAAWLVTGMYLQKVQLGDSLVAAHQSDAALQHLIGDRAAAYHLNITYPDDSVKHFSLRDMGLKVDTAATLASLRQHQSQIASRIFWWQPVTVYLTAAVDEAKLNHFIADSAIVTIQPAKDATLSLSDGKVRLDDSVPGKHYGLSSPVSTLLSAAGSLQSQPLQLRTLSTRPAVTSQQLGAVQAKLKQILSEKIVFVVDNKKLQATPADIATWIELTPKTIGKGIDLDVDSGKVLAYINRISATSAHPPKAQVQVTQPDGSISVLIAGVSGTAVINQDTAAAEVAQSVLTGTDIQANLSVQHTAYKTITAQAYSKWIEVDTTNKRMYAYEQTDLVRTFLISAGAPRTPTPSGQFAIYAKYVQQDMRGRNVDGSSYFQPAVPWVNYFYGDDAIHGNYWRPLSYFGNVNSSHGCVGIVDSDAEWVYSWAPIGTPVIVHA